jgi:hypothetical protein
MSGFLASGQEKAEEFLRHSVALWVDEQRITASEAAELLGSLKTAHVAAGAAHLGAHFAISLPLRFPLGALARFSYTLILRLRAELLGLFRRGSARDGRSLHTLPVMLIALLPGFGRLAYFASPALAGERLLLIIPMDQVSRRLPLRVYERFHLSSLFLYWAQPQLGPSGLRRFAPARLLASARAALAQLTPTLTALGAVIALDAAVFGVGTYIYLASDRLDTWWFAERSVLATMDALQLLIAGVAGIAAYRAFWRTREPEAAAGTADAYGMFLWGAGGVGLVLFALEDYFTVHETLGRRFGDLVGLMPIGTNATDDIFILSYAVVAVFVLYIFHTELVAPRASSGLLVAAAVSSVVMVLTDAFARSLALQALELPAQTLAATLLMFAFIARYREVRQAEVSSPAGLTGAQVAG